MDIGPAQGLRRFPARARIASCSSSSSLGSRSRAKPTSEARSSISSSKIWNARKRCSCAAMELDVTTSRWLDDGSVGLHRGAPAYCSALAKNGLTAASPPFRRREPQRRLPAAEAGAYKAVPIASARAAGGVSMVHIISKGSELPWPAIPSSRTSCTARASRTRCAPSCSRSWRAKSPSRPRWACPTPT